MGYASISGRAIANPSNPRAFAVCDRCGAWQNHDKLMWQYEWAGTRLVNLQLLVCSSCLDDPQPQLRAVVLSADPVPIRDPRPELSSYLGSFRGAQFNNSFSRSTPTADIPPESGGDFSGDFNADFPAVSPPGGLDPYVIGGSASQAFSQSFNRKPRGWVGP